MVSSSLIVKRQPLTGAICLFVSGDVDLANASDLLAHLKAVLQTEDNLIVEMSGLRYLDSSGIKVLLEMYQRFTQVKRRMVLAAVTSRVEKVLHITGVDQAIAMFPTAEGALSSICLGDTPPLRLAGE